MNYTELTTKLHYIFFYWKNVDKMMAKISQYQIMQ